MSDPREPLNQYRPAALSPPGQTISDLLEERGIRQTELATRMDVTPKFVNELIAGKAGITPATALALEKALDVPADFWLVRDAHYQAVQAREALHAEMAASVSWLDELPLKDMRDYRWVSSQPDKPSYVAACLKFFGVASVAAWRKQYVNQTVGSAAYRASEKLRSMPGAVAAWLRAGEVAAASIQCSPFDRERFMRTLDEVRKLTVEANPKKFFPALCSLFADCGVAVTIVRAPKGCPISGAVRWLSPQKALIQLSMRGLSDDVFWFTVFHECGHIALHGKKMVFVEQEGMTGAEEDEANRFAADRLIPPTEWARFSPFVLGATAITEFATRLGIAPGIIVGRLQKEGKLGWNDRLGKLKNRYQWSDA